MSNIWNSTQIGMHIWGGSLFSAHAVVGKHGCNLQNCMSNMAKIQNAMVGNKIKGALKFCTFVVVQLNCEVRYKTKTRWLWAKFEHILCGSWKIVDVWHRIRRWAETRKNGDNNLTQKQWITLWDGYLYLKYTFYGSATLNAAASHTTQTVKVKVLDEVSDCLGSVHFRWI